MNNNEKLHCYIATYYSTNNYGTKLQNYALINALKLLNIEASTFYLDDTKESRIERIIKNIAIHLPSFTTKQKIWKNIDIKKEKFKLFNEKLNYHYTTLEELYKLNFDKTFAIAGSDQIWSPLHLQQSKKDIDLFFLDFVPKDKRYTYAPSFGVTHIPQELKSFYREKFNNFNKISVREIEGKKLVKEISNIDCEIVPDPVFLLSKKEWFKLLEINSPGSQIMEKKYVLNYFLGKPNKQIIESISKYARNNNCKVITIAGNYYEQNTIAASPNEFLSLIANCEMMVTDSFHACVFSIIFNKQFFVLERDDVKQFSRIENLLSKFSLQSRKIKSNEFDVLSRCDAIDYYQINKSLVLDKEKGINYLRNIINNQLCNSK